MKRLLIILILTNGALFAQDQTPVSATPNSNPELIKSLKNIESTEKYVIRYTRIPATDGKSAKLIRVEIPVFRWKDGIPPISTISEKTEQQPVFQK